MPLPRYLQKKLDTMTWPMVLVLKDKHDTGYYVLAGRDDLEKACLHVLKQRLDPKYGYICMPESEPYGLVDELTDEQIAVLPERLRVGELKSKKLNARIRREHAEELEKYAEAKRALKEQDGLAAWQILSDRASYEYEGFELVTPVRL